MQEGKLEFIKDIETLQEETGELKLGKAIARIMKGNQMGIDWIEKYLQVNRGEKIF
jgi:Cu-processing system ATP-binding protein